MRLIIEGWRYLPHSYGVVDQFLSLELLRRPGVELFHRDIPFVNPRVNAGQGSLGDEEIERRLAEIPEAPQGLNPDATLRLFVPLDFRRAQSGRTLIFGTAEFGIFDETQIGQSSLAALNVQPDLAILTPSEWSRSGFIRAGADADKVVVIPHGVDPNLFYPPDETSRLALRREAGFGDDFVFLNIGALTANKGIFMLLRAFAGIVGDFPSARLVLKGLDGVYGSASCLDEYLRALSPPERAVVTPRLTYLGKTLTYAQTASLYRAADAYVSPYHAEGFNLPVLEAAACGLPVVCTGGGPTDAFTAPSFALRIDSRLQRAAVTGIPAAVELIPDVEHLARQMRRLLDDRGFAQNARRAGPEFVASRFTWKQVVDRLIELLSDPHAPAWRARPITAPAAPRRRPTPVTSQLQSAAWNSYRSGDPARTRQLCKEILGHDPLFTDAIYLLGVLAIDAGSPQEAALHFHHAASLRPDVAVYHNALGEAYHLVFRPEEAVDCFRAAIRLDPTLAAAHNALGRQLMEAGDADGAIKCFRAALAAQPDYQRAHVNLGTALHSRGDLPAARESFAEAVRLNPNYATAHNNLGAVSQAQGQLADAAAHFQKAIALQPSYPEAHCNLGSVLLAQGDPVMAALEFREAIRLRPAYARAHAMLGQSLVEAGQVAASVASLRASLRLRPDDIDTLLRLGDVLRLLGNTGEATEAFDQALRLDPNHPHAFAQRFRLRAEVCDWRDWPAVVDRLWDDARNEMEAGRPASINPMFALALPWPSSAHLAVARSHAAAFQQAALDAPSRINSPEESGARLKIGYLSRDFYDHPVAHLMVSMLGLHDRKKFEVHAYSFGPNDGSSYRRRIESDCEHFHDCASLNLFELDRAIRADGIQILVDLMGYSGLARTACVARRPAPIQVSWLGYAGTMGASFIDYIIGDPIVTPPALAGGYSEQIVRLPHTYMVTDHRQTLTATTRPQHRLPSDAIVFCCFNNAYKIEPEIFGVWMKILSQVPGSVAWLSAREPAARANLRREAQARGVSPDRLIFSEHLKAKADHLGRLALADLFLDTHLYNAHATACDALRAGVPVITCPAETFASRVASSLLGAVGLRALSVPDLSEYERMAVRLARDPAALQKLREELTKRRAVAPLFDTPRFVVNLERAYSIMWQRHAAGTAPAPLDVFELSE